MSSHKPFLRQIAQYFQSKPGLHDYCFVLPNHRSCKFFERELDMAATKTYLMPEVKTITDFVTSLTGSVVVKPVEALFVLYKCYTAIKGNEDYPFDKFIYWGNVVLNDFNDVDMYLVNPEKLFKNVKEHREIQANYLDADLQEIMSHYFKFGAEGIAAQSEEFWKNYENDTDQGSVKAEYLRLWQSLLPLYNAFISSLKSRNQCTMGMAFRNAVDIVKQGDMGGNEKYVFVGFNMLSTSELAIFKRLKQQDRALFFWDVASPAFADASIKNGANYVKFLKRELPEPDDFCCEKIEEFPAVDVVGVPSNVGQAKYFYHLMEELIDAGAVDGNDAINTALVLPDEGLLVPLLNSLTPKIKKVNVTMGYPLASSDIASLMRCVAKMHNQARKNSDGEWTFYRGDVRIVLSHPIVKTYFADDALKVVREMSEQNLFAVPQSLFLNTKLELLFHTLDSGSDVESVKQFLQRHIDLCNIIIDAINNDANLDYSEEVTTETSPITLQEAFLRQYIEVVEQLISALERYQIPPCESSLFFLIDRLSASFSIPFEGEPLQGLQIMGMLETRCLDFDNIIILSSNEGMLPGKIRSNSFISDFMRHNYAMSTTADQETMWNYYFYRLIGRAQKLIMVYNTSDQEMGDGEVTRYVPQLDLVYGCKLSRRMFTTSSAVSDPINIMVPKRGHTLEKLNTFRSGQGHGKLSASSIKEFVNCGLMFYFDRIEGLLASDSDDDFMDAGTFGNIVHSALQHLYYPDDGGEPRQGEYRVTCADIKKFKRERLAAIVQELVNKEYLHNTSSAALVGEASIVSVAITRFATAALDYDIKLLNDIDTNFFTVLECERKHTITLNYGGVDFNFTYVADRIDRLSSGQLRIVDYKTGQDETSIKGVEDLFSVTSTKNRGILQLMLYCNAYAQEMNISDPIRPVIYTLRDMSQTGVFINKQQLTDYHNINDEFSSLMDNEIEALFDEERLFGPTSNTDSATSPCRFCKYADFCRR